MVKKGYIRCFGDSKTGMGHVFRSLTVLDRIKQAGSDANILLYENEAAEIRDILIRNHAEIELIEKGAELPRGDFLLYDMPYPSKTFISEFKKRNIESLIVALDYSDSSDENVDLVFNLFDHNRMLPGRDLNRHTVFLSGFEYGIIRKDFYRHRGNDRNISERLENILITFGGSDPNNNTFKTLSCKSVSSRKNVAVVIGPRFSIRERISEHIAGFGKNIRFFGPIGNIQDFMSAADLVICGGGTTMLEAMYLGCPVLVVPQTEDEWIFSSFAADKEACCSICFGKDDEINDKIAMLESRGIRIKLSDNAKRLVPGNGAEIIAGILLK